MQMWGISEREKHQKMKRCLKIWDRNNISFKLQSCNNHSARCAVCSVQRAVCTSSGHWHKQLRDLRSRESREEKKTHKVKHQASCPVCSVWCSCSCELTVTEPESMKFCYLRPKNIFAEFKIQKRFHAYHKPDCCVFLNITAIKNCSSC